MADSRFALFLLFYLATFLTYLPVSAGYQPRITIENGVVVGYYGFSSSGMQYMKFEGIPYAKPPTDGRRFKEPERLERWIGEWNATSPGSPCLQLDHFTRERTEDGDIKYGIIGDEDCLFLNVYTQEKGPIDKEVIVYIHGGAFMFGGSNFYSPEYLMDNENLVFVSLNYRLGPLGFLTTGDSFVPGNNGLKDQVAALEWVQRNIAAFSGDPNKVTLIGLSAGGASVHYHYLSPLSEGLFSKGYSYSGTALCPWALVRDGVQKTKELAANLGCPTLDSKTILKCLKRRPARKIVEQVRKFHAWLYNPFTVFGPVVEVDSISPFIDKLPIEILQNNEGKDLPWILGFTSEDGLYPAGDFVDNDLFLEQLNQKWEAIAPSLMFYSEEPKQVVAQKLKQAYLKEKEFSRESVPQIIQMFSDRLFIAPAVAAAILQAKANTQPVYLYKYSYKNERSVSSFNSESNATFGTCHGDDFAYVVKFYGFETHVKEEDQTISDVLINILTTFAQSGSPPSSLKWEPVSPNTAENLKYLHIRTPERMKMEEGGGDIGNRKLWARILRQKIIEREEL